MTVTCDLNAQHRSLRSETREWHDRVERVFERFDLARPEGLDGFIVAQGNAILSIENALGASGVERLVHDWSSRRRGPAVEADLADRGLMPMPALRMPTLSSQGRILGAVYVLEGSRLGGKVLARRIKAGQGGNVPRFLSHDLAPGAWQQFLAVLDAADCPWTELLAGANDAFGVFHSAAACLGSEAEVALVRDALA